MPLFVKEILGKEKGIFSSSLNSETRKKGIIVTLGTGLIFAASTFLYVICFEKAGTVNTAIALQAYPIISLMIEVIYLKRKPELKDIAFTLLLVLGLYYLSTRGTFLIENISIWLAITLTVPLLWSIAHITIREQLTDVPITANQITSIRVFVAVITLGFVISIVDSPQSIVSAFMNPLFQAFALMMGVAYYLELVAWFSAIRHIDVSLASAVTTPSPILTTIFAVILLQEELQGFQVIALVVILISLYGILLKSKHPDPQVL